jgi:hypothetical protein
MGQAGRLKDGKFRRFLNSAAPGVLRWFEQSSGMDDESFWESKIAQSIDAAPIEKPEKEGGPNGAGDGSGGSAGPGDDPDSESP